MPSQVIEHHKCLKRKTPLIGKFLTKLAKHLSFAPESPLCIYKEESHTFSEGHRHDMQTYGFSPDATTADQGVHEAERVDLDSMRKMSCLREREVLPVTSKTESERSENISIKERIVYRNSNVRRRHNRLDGSGSAEVILANGSRTVSEWDGLGKTTLTKFDQSGKITEQSIKSRNGFLRVTKWNEQGDRERSTFDHDGRKIVDEIMYANGSGILQKYERTGSLSKQIYDCYCNSSTTTIDRRGRIIASEYQYSDGARIVERYDNKGNSRRFDYNDSDELTSIRQFHADGSSKTCAYSKIGERLETEFDISGNASRTMFYKVTNSGFSNARH